MRSWISLSIALLVGCSSPTREADDGGSDAATVDSASDTSGDGSTKNACGGSVALALAPGDACGACGKVECSGTDKVVCKDAGFNACGGCGVLTGTLGDACGACGKQRCSADKSKIECQDPGKNSCGGCTALAGKPGDKCGGGTCGTGVFICDGLDALKCEGVAGANACGGCGTLEGTPGAACGGVCKTAVWKCAADGGSVVCTDPIPKEMAPGNVCGTCKTLKTICAKGGLSTFCPGDDTNDCGGCGVLPGIPGEACGLCGVYVCQLTKLVCKSPPKCIPDL
ncbi:MAG: hypothetical protein JNL79_06355 [Myxococcales bacterium]|nr:hypothetical protein [Myxococcales bacterium]